MEQDVNDVPATTAATQLELQAVVSETVSDPGFLQYVIMNSASLSSNPQIQELIRSSDFLDRLANPDEVIRLLQGHPDLMRGARNALGEWLTMQQEEINENPRDEQESMEAESTSQQETQEAPAAPRQITPGDVAAALASAQRDLAPAISINMVSQAVAEAVTVTRQQRRRQRWEVQLAQLRAMGISDEAACIHALEATRGDVEAALNLLMK